HEDRPFDRDARFPDRERAPGDFEALTKRDAGLTRGALREPRKHALRRRERDRRDRERRRQRPHEHHTPQYDTRPPTCTRLSHPARHRHRTSSSLGPQSSHACRPRRCRCFLAFRAFAQPVTLIGVTRWIAMPFCATNSVGICRPCVSTFFTLRVSVRPWTFT